MIPQFTARAQQLSGRGRTLDILIRLRARHKCCAGKRGSGGAEAYLLCQQNVQGC